MMRTQYKTIPLVTGYNKLVLAEFELTAAVQLLEEKAPFVRHVLNDKQSLGAIIGEAEAKLESFRLSREHADAMIALAQKLPALAESLEKVEEGPFCETSC